MGMPDDIHLEDLEDCLLQVLQKERGSGQMSYLSQDDINKLLVDTERIVFVNRMKEPGAFLGYPNSPLYKDIANTIFHWIQNGRCPVMFQQKFDQFDEGDNRVQREMVFKELNSDIDGLVSLWSFWSPAEREFRLSSICQKLGRRGIINLLGVRKTLGSADWIPPTREMLFKAFTKPVTSTVSLSVGARALDKHCHRDQTSSWWGTAPTGSEKTKNKRAIEILNKIFDDAAWINIHRLPGDVESVEVRQTEGYGARFTADGQTFRGFLEPYTEGGHDVGWVH